MLQQSRYISTATDFRLCRIRGTSSRHPTEDGRSPRHTFRGISEVLLEQASLLSRSLYQSQNALRQPAALPGWRGHGLLRRRHRRNGGRRPPGWAAQANAVPTRRSDLLSSPSQTGETTDPMKPARPNQSRKRSRTRFLSEGFAEFDLGLPHFCIGPSWPRTSR